METVPIELEETPLKLEVVIDPKTKCVTMNTHKDTSRTTTDTPNIFSKDPLQKEDDDEPDFEKMTELEKIIYSERQRILQAIMPIGRLPPKKVNKNKEDEKKTAASSDESELDLRGLTETEKSRLRTRRRRARETDEQRETRKFRQRIATMKIRLLQRLKNFDNESYLEDAKKRNTEQVRQRRLERQQQETPEEQLERKKRTNNINRLAKLRRKVFATPEELKRNNEKKRISFYKCFANKTEEERLAYQKFYREQSKERYRKKNMERKKFDLMSQGKTIGEIEAMDDDAKFKKGPVRPNTQFK